MDACDAAQIEIDAALEQALAMARQRVSYAGTQCVVCGEDIEAARRKLGLARCLACQQEYEKRP